MALVESGTPWASNGNNVWPSGTAIKVPETVIGVSTVSACHENFIFSVAILWISSVKPVMEDALTLQSAKASEVAVTTGVAVNGGVKRTVISF